MNFSHKRPYGATGDAARTSIDVIAKTIARLQTNPDDLKSIYGPKMRGLVPLIFNSDGTTPLTDEIRLILDEWGRAVGFVIANDIPIDYRKPRKNEQALRHASNSNLARSFRKPPIEEQLVRAIKGVPLSHDMLTALEAYGLPNFSKIDMWTAHKIACGIVSECSENATGAEQQGVRNQLFSFPPTVRFDLAPLLLACPQSDMNRDLLLAAPILALAPSKLASSAGMKPKAVLRALGLPVEARKLKPRALSPIKRLALHDGGDLSGDDVPWLTPLLLNALPNHGLQQLRVIDSAFTFHMHGMSSADVTARASWIAQHAAEIVGVKGQLEMIVDWLRADPDALTRYTIRLWSPDISSASAIKAAHELRDVHTRLTTAASADPFRVPPWAEIGERLPTSKWTLRPIRNESDLILAARRNANCAAAYADACRRGSTLIVEVIRPITRGSKLPNDGEHETGALAEISYFRGRLQVIQVKGFANSEPVATAASALNRLIDDLNPDAVEG